MKKLILFHKYEIIQIHLIRTNANVLQHECRYSKASAKR